MVSLMGGNVGDDKAISTGMEAGSGNTGYGKDVSVSGGMEGDV